MTDDPASLDSQLALLADRRRRWLVEFMESEQSTRFALETLVAHVRSESQATPGQVPSRHEVAVALHHVHLPKLAAASVLTYDTAAGTVRFLGLDSEVRGWPPA